MDKITIVRTAGAVVDLLEGLGCGPEEMREVLKAARKHIAVKQYHFPNEEALATKPVPQCEPNLN